MLGHDDIVVAGVHHGDLAETADDGTYTATLAQHRGEMDAPAMDRDAFATLGLVDGPPRPAGHERIVETSPARETRSDEAASQLALGPNHGAASRHALTGD